MEGIRSYQSIELFVLGEKIYECFFKNFIYYLLFMRIEQAAVGLGQKVALESDE